MKSTKIRIITLILLLSLLAVGVTTIAGAQEGTDQPQASAYVKFAHYAPYDSVITDTEVTLSIDGVDQFTFMYGEIFPARPTDPPQAAPYFEITDGDHLITITPTGSTDPLLSETISFGTNSFNTIVIIGNGTLQPLEYLQLIDVDPNDLDPDYALVRLANVAPTSANIEDTRVDICTADGAIWMGLSNIAYKEFADPYMQVPIGEANLTVSAPGTNCGTDLYEFPGLWFRENQIADMYVVGDNVNQPIDHNTVTGLLYTEPGGEDDLPMVNLAHVAPYENNLNLDPINIYIDGVLVAENFDFLQFSGYSEMEAGEYEVVMEQYVGGAILATGTILLENDKYYTLHLIGDDTNQPLEVWLLEDEIEPFPDAAKIRIVNAAPISPVLAETELDICNADNTLVKDLEAIPYKGYTDPYDKFDAGYYRLKGSKTGTNCVETIAGLFPYIMDNGDVATIYIFGANVIPTGQIPWPDISAHMLFLNIVLVDATPIP